VRPTEAKKTHLCASVNKIRAFSIIAALGLALSACENTVDINAPWKETLVVYGLLDPYDSVQRIRVNKAFLGGDGTVYQTAQISDSLFADSVLVTLTRTATGQQIPCTPEWSTQKDSGIFASQYTRLWTTRERIYPNEVYEIRVQNPLSGTSIYSSTRSVGDAKIQSPFNSVTNLFSVGPEYITVSFTPGANTYAYDVKFYVHYESINALDTNQKSRHTAVWSMLRNYYVQPGIRALNQIPRLSFLQFLANTIPSDPNTLHRLKNVGIVFYGGNQQLLDYISVNEPSIGIVQKQAEYSNIDGGLGLFASRSQQKIDQVPIHSASIQYLAKHPTTLPLNLIP